MCFSQSLFQAISFLFTISIFGHSVLNSSSSLLNHVSQERCFINTDKKLRIKTVKPVQQLFLIDASSSATTAMDQHTSNTTSNQESLSKESTDNNLGPKWINRSHFMEILSENVPEFSKIKSFSVKPAMGAGENYASLILRISIDVELTDKTIKPISYMMKVPHDNDDMQQIFKSSIFFNIENDAYMNILPKFEKLYKVKGLDIKLATRAYKFKDSLLKEPKLANTVLMCDLGQDGYRNLNRLEGLNFEQTKFALKKMAQYHAVGAQCFKVNGPYSDTMMQGMFGADNEKIMAMFKALVGPFQKMFLSNLKNYKHGDKYLSKFLKLFPELNKQFPILNKYDPTEFNVLNHGDCWTNNLLFKLCPKAELNDMVFVDFQLLKYGHPSKDIYNFILTSVHIDHKLKDFDYFIYYYHNQLIEHLQILGYKERMPTLRELHIQLFKYCIWAIIASFIPMAVVLLDPNESATIEYLMGNTEACDQFKNLMYTNKRYIAHITQILPWLDNRGFLNVELL